METGQEVVLYGPNNKPLLKQPDFNDPRIWTILNQSNPFGASSPKDLKALLDAYTSWVQISIHKVAMTLARIPILLFNDEMGMGEDLGDPIKSHKIYDIWRNPNPGLRQTRIQLFLKTWIHLELTGNAYWFAPGVVAGRPNMIFILRPDKVKILTEGAGDLLRIIGYKYGDMDTPFSPEDIVHFKYPDPNNPVYGLSRLSSQAYPYDTDHALGIHELSFFKNRGVVDLIFAVKGMTQPQAEEYKRQWVIDHQGPQNAFKPSFIPAEDVKMEKVSQTSKDAEVGATANRVRDKILSAYDMPAAKVGIVKDVNRANGDYIDTIFARESLQSRADLFTETLSTQFTPRFDPRIVAKQKIPVPRDREFEQKTDTENVKNGLETINEIAEKRGYSKKDWGDQWWAPFNYVPIGEGIQTDQNGKSRKHFYVNKDSVREIRWKRFVALTDPVERAMAREIKKFFDRQKEEILERVSEFGPTIENTFEGWSKAKVKDYLTKQSDLIDQIMGDSSGYVDELAELMKPYEYASYTEHGEAALEELGALEIDFALSEVQGLEWVDWKVAQSAQKVNDATFLLLGDTLQEGMIAGEDIRELQGRVSYVFEGSPRASRASSERIARTEIIGVSNKGAEDGYHAGGVGKKEWIAAIDERTREEHIEADGQIVGIKQSFTVMGENLQFPGDPSGSPENIINCRCTIGPVISD
jgi:HK97 family phage portal protein